MLWHAACVLLVLRPTGSTEQDCIHTCIVRASGGARARPADTCAVLMVYAWSSVLSLQHEQRPPPPAR